MSILNHLGEDFNQNCNYVCKICDYYTLDKWKYSRHCSTAKHKGKIECSYEGKQNNDIIYHNKYNCNCGKKYNHIQSWNRHKKKCNYSETNMQSNVINKQPNIINETLIIEIMKQNNELQKQNQEFQKMMVDELKELKQNTNNNINNSYNKTTNNFNLNLFLHEKCKDALNLSEFIETLEVGLNDLENTAKLGYAEGISQIIINGLKSLSVTDRPIHCTDAKRDIIYIKDQDIWTKQEETKDNLQNAIKLIGHKNIKQIPEWQKKHPNFSDPQSKENDKYLKLLCNVMNGSTIEEQQKNMTKIIKNISKHVVIDKEIYK